MSYVPTFNRDQMMVCSWDSFIDSESVARLMKSRNGFVVAYNPQTAVDAATYLPLLMLKSYNL